MRNSRTGNRIKLIRVTTIPMSLDVLLEGQLDYLNQFYDVVGVSSGGDTLDEVALREKIRVKELPMQRAISPIRDLVSLFKLYRFFRKERPEIVHSITPKAGLLSMMAAFLAGVPVRMHMFTGLVFPTQTGIMQWVLIQMDRIICKCATHVYPEGEGVKNDLVKYKITRKELPIIGNGNVNGIDTQYFSKSHFSEEELIRKKVELGIDPKDFVLVFVGRLVKDKGINELVEAFNSLLQSQPKSSLLLVGPFEDDRDPVSEKSRSEINSSEKIINTGYQNDVRIFYALSDALVFPSYREGFPNVVLQAGAMELPSIVTNINGSNEIISENVNGLVIPSKDSDALLQAMHKMIENKELYDSMKENAREIITSRYEQRKVWEALLEEYRNLEAKL